ncbi:hypothetical protein CC85DRAFT_281530 [Cutaneotrichosporon oleaginosum]|uniref:Uncharacterized protein n=1 Tax=Cutaneotrichosporon oleaginosum TaxID=879819 RepID=A0A0J0XZH1_9TREE|nr:uncharacterized protein CC85DRAFT_281530 [Cutaneotrichosporon oleaginosum]KLT46435.1 hypothetical protein CC85DRAFT_281530 [Cutaneotrichosporon oleaginosum]TXT15195.1 hypothetical protein COLE_01388 [Cutaneotrichosporon oleaginosum]
MAGSEQDSIEGQHPRLPVASRHHPVTVRRHTPPEPHPSSHTQQSALQIRPTPCKYKAVAHPMFAPTSPPSSPPPPPPHSPDITLAPVPSVTLPSLTRSGDSRTLRSTSRPRLRIVAPPQSPF